MTAPPLATDKTAFLRAICERPADDAPRLVYADWLDDHGEGERAEFIRVQAELARLDCHHGPDAGATPWCKVCVRRHALRRRERELWGYLPERNGVLRQMSDSLPGFVLLLGSDKGNGLTNDYPWCVVRRGFVDSVSLTIAALLGGDCPACEGRGEVDAPDPASGRTTGEWQTACRTCNGQRTVPGIAAELGRLPLTNLAIVDREPECGDDVLPHWSHQVTDRDPEPCRLPPELAKLVGVRPGFHRSYPSADAAKLALSRAALSHVRTLAGTGGAG